MTRGGKREGSGRPKGARNKPMQPVAANIAMRDGRKVSKLSNAEFGVTQWRFGPWPHPKRKKAIQHAAAH